MEEYKQFWGRRIRLARETAGQSQRSLAIAMSVDQAMVSRWERGLATPRDDKRLRLAEVLGVHPDHLFSYEPDNGNAAA